MPDVKFGIDSTGADQGATRFEESGRRVAASARTTGTAIDELTRQVKALKQAMAESNVADLVKSMAQIASASAALESGKQRQVQSSRALAEATKREADAMKIADQQVAGLVRGLTSLDSATRSATQKQVSLLSTFGQGDRAVSQQAAAYAKLAQSMAGGAVTAQDAARQHARIPTVFSAANVTAKDLRLNMQRLSEEMSKLGMIASIGLGPLNGIAARMATMGALAKSSGYSFALMGAGVAGVVVGLSAFTAKAIESGDMIRRLEGRLSIVYDTSEEVKRAMTGLFEVAQRTRQNFEGTAEVYTRLALATRDTGKSQAELNRIVETVNKTVAISGSSAQEARAAMIQFAQGMSSGRLAGEELRSVLEQVPRLAQLIAEGMGVTIGELRKMGAEGELTTKAVLGALEKGAQRVDDEFSKLPVTVAQANEQMGNSITMLIAEVDKFTGISANISNVWSSIAASLGEAARKMKEINDEAPDSPWWAPSGSSFGSGYFNDEQARRFRELQAKQEEAAGTSLPWVSPYSLETSGPLALPTSGESTAGSLLDPSYLTESNAAVNEVIASTIKLADKTKSLADQQRAAKEAALALATANGASAEQLAYVATTHDEAIEKITHANAKAGKSAESLTEKQAKVLLNFQNTTDQIAAANQTAMEAIDQRFAKQMEKARQDAEKLSPSSRSAALESREQELVLQYNRAKMAEIDKEEAKRTKKLAEQVVLLEEVDVLHEQAFGTAASQKVAELERNQAKLLKRIQESADATGIDMTSSAEQARIAYARLIEESQAGFIDLGATIRDSFKEAIIGIARGTGSLKDIFGNVSDAIKGQFISAFADVLMEKSGFDAKLNVNFLQDIPKMASEGATGLLRPFQGVFNYLSGGSAGVMGTVSAAGAVSAGSPGMPGAMSIASNGMWTSPYAAEGMSVSGVGQVAGGAGTAAAGGTALAGGLATAGAGALVMLGAMGVNEIIKNDFEMQGVGAGSGALQGFAYGAILGPMGMMLGAIVGAIIGAIKPQEPTEGTLVRKLYGEVEKDTFIPRPETVTGAKVGYGDQAYSRPVSEDVFSWLTSQGVPEQTLARWGDPNRRSLEDRGGDAEKYITGALASGSGQSRLQEGALGLGAVMQGGEGSYNLTTFAITASQRIDALGVSSKEARRYMQELYEAAGVDLPTALAELNLVAANNEVSIDLLASSIGDATALLIELPPGVDADVIALRNLGETAIGTQLDISTFNEELNISNERMSTFGSTMATAMAEGLQTGNMAGLRATIRSAVGQGVISGILDGLIKGIMAGPAFAALAGKINTFIEAEIANPGSGDILAVNNASVSFVETMRPLIEQLGPSFQLLLSIFPELTSAANDTRSAIEGIDDFLRELNAGSSSPLAAATVLANAKADWDVTYAAAMQGDAAAQARLTTVAGNYLGAAEGMYAHGDPYWAINAIVQTGLTDISNMLKSGSGYTSATTTTGTTTTTASAAETTATYTFAELGREVAHFRADAHEDAGALLVEVRSLRSENAELKLKLGLLAAQVASASLRVSRSMHRGRRW